MLQQVLFDKFSGTKGFDNLVPAWKFVLQQFVLVYLPCMPLISQPAKRLSRHLTLQASHLCVFSSRCNVVSMYCVLGRHYSGIVSMCNGVRSSSVS